MWVSAEVLVVVDVPTQPDMERCILVAVLVVVGVAVVEDVMLLPFAVDGFIYPGAFTHRGSSSRVTR